MINTSNIEKYVKLFETSGIAELFDNNEDIKMETDSVYLHTIRPILSLISSTDSYRYKYSYYFTSNIDIIKDLNDLDIYDITEEQSWRERLYSISVLIDYLKLKNIPGFDNNMFIENEQYRFSKWGDILRSSRVNNCSVRYIKTDEQLDKDGILNTIKNDQDIIVYKLC